MNRVKFFLTLFLITFINTYSQASSIDLSESDMNSIKLVVRSQLDAFAIDDFEKAYSYAAPTIKQIFPSSDIFKNMVISQYQAVYRPKKITFGDVIIFKGNPALNVFLVGPSGNFVTATYVMEKQENDLWLISGCILSMSSYEQI